MKKKRIRRAIKKLIRAAIIATVSAAIMVALLIGFIGAMLQESYKLCPLTEEELAAEVINAD